MRSCLLASVSTVYEFAFVAKFVCAIYICIFLVYNKFFKSVYSFWCCPVMVFSMCLATTYCQTCYDLYSLWDLTNLIHMYVHTYVCVCVCVCAFYCQF